MEKFSEKTTGEKIMYIIGVVAQLFILMWVLSRPIMILANKEVILSELLTDGKLLRIDFLAYFFSMCFIVVGYLGNWVYGLELIRNKKYKKSLLIWGLNLVCLVFIGNPIITGFFKTLITSLCLFDVILVFFESFFDDRKIRYDIVRLILLVLFLLIILQAWAMC